MPDPMSPSPLTTLTEDQQMLVDEVRRLAEEKVRPLVRASDEAGKMDPSAIAALFEMGLMAVDVPEEYGGAGMTFMSVILAVEQLARVDPSVAVVMDVQNTLVNNCITRWGTEEQKKRWLSRLSADAVGAYALSEAGSGSDAFSLAARAVRDGDDYLLNGQKLWITNGGEAQFFIVFANANPEAGYKGITAFVIERDAPGLTVGKKEDKLGIRASSTVEIVLQDVRVPADGVLGEVGKGYKVAMEALNEGRIGIGAQMVGLAQGSLDASLAYVQGAKPVRQDPRQVPGGPVRPRPRCRASWKRRSLTVYNAARLKDSGLPFVREAATRQVVCFRGGRARVEQGGRSPRWLWLHQGVSGGEALPRRQDRQDLRGHVEHAAADDREDTARVAERSSFGRWRSALRSPA